MINSGKLKNLSKLIEMGEVSDVLFDYSPELDKVARNSKWRINSKIQGVDVYITNDLEKFREEGTEGRERLYADGDYEVETEYKGIKGNIYNRYTLAINFHKKKCWLNSKITATVWFSEDYEIRDFWDENIYIRNFGDMKRLLLTDIPEAFVKDLIKIVDKGKKESLPERISNLVESLQR